MKPRTNPSSTVPRAVLVTVLLCLGASRPSHAQSRTKQSAEGHYERGMKAYTLGKFADAIEEFEKAYELRSEPIFLYNIAQSHRQNNAPQRAIFFYRRYLEAEPNAKNRADIEKRIKDMEAQLATEKDAAAPPVLPPPPVALPAPPPTPTAEPAPPIAAPAASLTANPGRGLRIAGIATASAGVVGVATGIFFALHANKLHDEAYYPKTGGFDSAKADSSESYRTLAWVTIGVGSAAIVTGGVLYYLGATAKPDDKLALLPWAAPHQAGVTLTGRF